MNDLAFLIQIQAFMARNSNGFSSAVIAFEEVKGIASGYDAGSLVVEEIGGRAFEESGIVAVRF